MNKNLPELNGGCATTSFVIKTTFVINLLQVCFYYKNDCHRKISFVINFNRFFNKLRLL